MAKAKAVSDEELVVALLDHGTIKEAAQAVGLSERTVYDRMTKSDFQAIYRAAKNDLIRSAVVSLNKRIQSAVDVIVDIMEDAETNPATRLQAAQTILSNAAKFSTRLQADEAAVVSQREMDKFLYRDQRAGPRRQALIFLCSYLARGPDPHP